MNKNKRMPAAERKAYILQWLKESERPITGGELSEKTNVSRQVIVQDISVLKAANEPIIATSQGYLYLQQNNQPQQIERVVACKHTPEETRKELELIVDQGVTVKDVFIEHPLYGDLSASIMVSNRSEVDLFIKKVYETNAPYLSQLTIDGIHLHTLAADSEEKLNAAYNALREADMVIEA